jgi:RNA polymerase sigma-70 factor (ECF subfamily)
MDQQAVKRLIELSIRGDHISFRRLVEMHQTFAWSVAYRLLNKQYETEEVVQEAFIRVWKKLSGFRKEMRFSTWLYKIVVNLCYDSLKAEKARKKYGDPDSTKELLTISSNDNIEKDMVNREQVDLIRMLTAKLSPLQKVVFVLSELEELPVDEIRAITGMSPSKIKSNLYCARREIREKLIAITNTRGSYAI